MRKLPPVGTEYKGLTLGDGLASLAALGLTVYGMGSDSSSVDTDSSGFYLEVLS